MMENHEEIEEEYESESETSFIGEIETVNYSEGGNEIEEKMEASKSRLTAVPSGIVTEQHLKDISHELGLIKLCWTDVPQIDFEERVHYPMSYLKNNEKEKLLLWYSENFRQQFSDKYPARRPLLLACDNECGVQKMVCTTIRPTTLKFTEFQMWQGCASFVSEHLTYEILENPTVLPDHMNSPQTVLRRQAGHSFEFSTLLVSLLIASAYDAYVVSGYATRETCRKDQTRVDCPLLLDEAKVVEKEAIEEDTKYFLKKPIQLESQFLLEMKARAARKAEEAQRIQELAELAAIREFEKPWPDELHNWRLHSWVVVLPSKDVVEPFFIESTTGIGKSLEDAEYLGIESIWNHQNYWVSTRFDHQTESCKDILFDLNNTDHWERLLIGEPFTFRKLPKELMEADVEEFNRACIEAEKHLDMPASWVDILKLPHSAYERRFPQAKKHVHYRKAVAEQYSPYSHSDGLLERVTRYNDYECQEPREIREKYGNRGDRMYFCQRTIADNSILEKFHRGREDALKAHFYYSMDTGIEVKFKLMFYHEARLDGLSELTMDPLYMTMTFEKRKDFLYYVHVDYAERTNQDQPLRVISKIVEKYHRNSEKDADKDVESVEFRFQEKAVHLKFHYEDEHVTQTRRTFQKPPFAERGASLAFDPALTSGYSTGPTVSVPKPLYLYRLEVEFFKREEIAEKKIRERENELLSLLRLRAQELAAPRLVVSEFDVERNEDAKKAFKERELEQRQMEERDMNLVCDFLAPYYAKFDIDPKSVLTHKMALFVINEFLEDWKGLLVARANDIQQQFEQACQDFYDKNNWYEQNQSVITKEQEEEYFDYCKKKSYYLHTLEVRLARHKELAPKRFLAVNSYLKNDPRLARAFFTKAQKRKPVSLPK